MITIEEVQTILDEIASEFPQEFYKDLNGGIVLLPQVKLHTAPWKSFMEMLQETG